jgi:hypothetical protein
MHTRFIIMSYGHFGVGATLDEAIVNHKKARRGQGRLPKDAKVLAFKYESPLPFCPVTETRDATEDEADAWVGRDGSTNYVRCSAQQIDPVTGGDLPDHPIRTEHLDPNDVRWVDLLAKAKPATA